MSLINCPECEAQISDTAIKCPKCGVQLRKPTRSFFGKLIKWLFVGFNILMLIWLISYWGTISEMVTTAGSEAERGGAAVGATIGSGMIITLWAFGDIILGLFVILTKPKA